LRLAEAELTSYAPVLEARTPEERLRALSAASEPPAGIAETAAEVAELGAEIASSASEAVRGDALTGVTLAEAAAAAAARLVEINVGSGPVFERARHAAQRAANARAAATPD
jgi:formiminotetrahydrofolate cyclodeaminase